MKKTSLILFIITAITFSCLAQSPDTIYFNKKWNPIPKEKKYEYVRIMKKVNDSLYTVMDYYKGGQLQMTGAFKSAKQEEEVGKFIWYSKKGDQINLIHFKYDQTNDTIKEHLLNKYSELKLLDSIKLEYFENYESEYITSGVRVNGKIYGTLKYLNKKKELISTSEYSNNKKNGLYVYYFNSENHVDESAYGKIWLTAYYKNGKEDSVWTYYFPDQSIEKKEKYKDGEKIENISFIGLDDWFMFKSNDYGFKIEFPKEPTIKSEILKSKNGDVKIIEFECNESKAKNIQNLGYLVIYAEIPAAFLIDSIKNVSSSDFLRKSINNTVKKYGKLLTEKEIEFKGYRGKEIQVKSKNGMAIITLRFYLIENKFITLGAITDFKIDFKVSTSRFMDSFDLINNN